MPSCGKLAAKGTQDHMARGRDPPLPKIPLQMRKVLGSSMGEVRELPPMLYLLCEETEGLHDCQCSTTHKQFKKYYTAKKNKIALYNKVLPHTHRACSASRKCVQKVLFFKLHP